MQTSTLISTSPSGPTEKDDGHDASAGPFTNISSCHSVFGLRGLNSGEISDSPFSNVEDTLFDLGSSPDSDSVAHASSVSNDNSFPFGSDRSNDSDSAAFTETEARQIGELQDLASTTQPEVVNPEDGGDEDSTFGDGADSSDCSITSFITDYPEKNGRTYHAYHQGHYLLPNDYEEMQRLDRQHEIYCFLLDGKFFLAPVHNPQRILDIGTGTGIWATDVADVFQGADVIGIDLSPIQPNLVPTNCKFVVDDIEMNWVYTRPFDLIHGRGLHPAVKDWPRLYDNILKNLKPGGYCEMQEWYPRIWIHGCSDMSKAPFTAQWIDWCWEGSKKKGLSFGVDHKSHMLEAGMVDIDSMMIEVPIGPWHTLEELGGQQLTFTYESVEPYTSAFIASLEEWSDLECLVLQAKVRQELVSLMSNSSIKMMTSYHFTYGRKPT